MKQLYYAHPIYLFGTEQEKRDLETLQTIFGSEYKIYNPNNPEAQKNYEVHGLEYFTRYIIDHCDLLVFRGTPDGRITAEVNVEVYMAFDHGIPVLEMPSLFCRGMSVEQTKLYLKEIGYR